MKAKILYIEDNRDNLRLVERLLVMNNYQFIGVEDAARGIEVAGAEQPDLILMDINLPGLDGYEATMKILSLPSLQDTPIVAVTANAMAGDRERALSVGCAGYITKPIDIDTFVSDIERFIDGQREVIDRDSQTAFLQEHNLRLVEKLEMKIRELEAAKENLEHEVGARTEELHIAHERLVELEKSKAIAEIAGTIAHELNQPLNIISGFCEILSGSEDNPSDQRKHLAVVMRQITRMAEIIQRLSSVTGYETKPYYKGKIINLEKASELAGLTTPLQQEEEETEASWVLARKLSWLEQQLQQSEGRVATARLLQKVLHKLNNHLQSVRGYTDLLLVSDEDEQTPNYVNKVSVATDRCIDLLRDFYSLLPMRNEISSADTESVDDLLRNAVALMERLYQRRGTVFRVDIDGGPYSSKAAKQQLVFLLLALLQASVERVKGLRDGEIVCRLQPGGTSLFKLSIRDNGEPIKEGAISSAAWVNDESTEEAPVAIALMVARGIAEQMGGSLNAGIRNGEVSTFTLELPKAEVEKRKHEPTRLDTAKTYEGSDRILIVDDEEPICFILKRHLEKRLDCPIDTCHSAEEALTLLEQREYSLLFLDINLPRASGLDILPSIREQYPAMNVVIITGLISNEDYELALSQGAAYCILKPIRRQELFEVLDKLKLPAVAEQRV